MFEKPNFLSQLSAGDPKSWLTNALQDQVEEHLAKKDFKAAKVLIEKSLKAGENEDAYLKLGILETMQGNNKKAIKAYEDCLGMNPFNETALINIGNLLFCCVLRIATSIYPLWVMAGSVLFLCRQNFAKFLRYKP